MKRCAAWSPPSRPGRGISTACPASRRNGRRPTSHRTRDRAASRPILPGGKGIAMVDYRKLFDLTGRRALVLGAGIGKASAEALGALGADVFCADLDKAGAKATAS